MNIISYRGPGMAGGVSAALERIWNSESSYADSHWAYLSDREIKYLSHNKINNAEINSIANLSSDFIDKHYRFCNEFLWPVLHDLPQYANFCPHNFQAYKSFNETFAWLIIRAGLSGDSFVQDYQMALVPSLLKDHLPGATSLFWHIPWPKNVSTDHLEPMRYVAEKMLAANTIGFHTQEYVDNFLRFVRQYLPNISPEILKSKNIIAHPLGVDFNYWSSLVALHESLKLNLPVQDIPFILSVDRADYTKGVNERLDAIDIFFEQFPNWQEKISFVQVTGKTRKNIAAFDNYWQNCQTKAQALNEKWLRKNNNIFWQPLIWIEDSLTSLDLAGLYLKTKVMLVNPIRDGLNLTAKEFVACQKFDNSFYDPGVLVLSTGAGVVHEYNSEAIVIESGCPQEMANAIMTALSLSSFEKAYRMKALKDRLKANSLMNWWNTFADSKTAVPSITVAEAITDVYTSAAQATKEEPLVYAVANRASR
jgi:trehalose-6-phosphate synthase